MIEEKKRFLSYELGLLSLKAALSTRDRQYPIYDKGTKVWQRTRAKNVLREWLVEIEGKYINGIVTEAEHISFIAEVAEGVSNGLATYLHRGRFRVGVAQKLVNVHLKYLWSAGFCPEPPHCPIDGIIRDAAGISYLWTRSDSIEEYKKAIQELKTISATKGLTLAQWELKTFRRRDDEEDL
jgi:hypothetical protein